MTREELRALMQQELACSCSKDDAGLFYEEIYVDYRDKMSTQTIKAILKSEDPRQAFYEELDEAFENSRWEVEDRVLAKLQEDNADLRAAYNEDADLFNEVFMEVFYAKLPDDHFLDQKVEINIVLDTGDANYDFVLNGFAHSYYGDTEEGVDTVSSLLWLCQQQGISKEKLEEVLETGEFFPPHTQALMDRRSDAISQLKELGHNPQSTSSFAQKMPYRSYLLQQEQNKKIEQRLRRVSQSLDDCALSYEEFCEKWSDTRLDSPPSKEIWACNRDHTLKASKKALIELEKQKSEVQTVLQEPDMQEIARLHDELRAISEEFKPIARSEEYQMSKFLKSVILESMNVSSAINALTFPVKMPMEQAISLQEAIRNEADLNTSYDALQRKGEGTIVIGKDARCGLYDSWNGAGSIFEVQLVKPVEIPIRFIHDANVDGSLGYGLNEIYGGFDYTECLEAIRPMEREREKPLDEKLQVAAGRAANQNSPQAIAPKHDLEY